MRLGLGGFDHVWGYPRCARCSCMNASYIVVSPTRSFVSPRMHMRLAVPRFVMLLISSCQHVQHCMGSVCRGPVFARGNAVVRVFFSRFACQHQKSLKIVTIWTSFARENAKKHGLIRSISNLSGTMHWSCFSFETGVCQKLTTSEICHWV